MDNLNEIPDSMPEPGRRDGLMVKVQVFPHAPPFGPDERCYTLIGFAERGGGVDVEILKVKNALTILGLALGETIHNGGWGKLPPA